jgi:hypothetical protein
MILEAQKMTYVLTVEKVLNAGGIRHN